MSLQLSAHARLGKDPREITTSTGKPMAVAPAAVAVPIARGDDASTVWLDLVAFGRVAETLLRHKQGDLANVLGNVQIRQWTDKGGQPRETWQLIVDALVSARTTRPGGGKRRETRHDGQQRQQQAADRFQQPQQVISDAEAGFDDAIPF